LNRNRILIIIAVFLVVVVGFLWASNVNPGKLPPIPNTIIVRDVGLCASNCIYPSPYLSALIFVNASVPLSTLHLFINGTDEGITTTDNAMTHYALLFKAGPNNPAMPIVDGKTYTIMVVATFQDNSTCTVSATVVAGSGSGITTTSP
jgi:hypothetical protein